jgi:hypothetical protein
MFNGIKISYITNISRVACKSLVYQLENIYLLLLEHIQGYNSRSSCGT